MQFKVFMWRIGCVRLGRKNLVSGGAVRASDRQAAIWRVQRYRACVPCWINCHFPAQANERPPNLKPPTLCVIPEDIHTAHVQTTLLCAPSTHMSPTAYVVDRVAVHKV